MIRKLALNDTTDSKVFISSILFRILQKMSEDLCESLFSTSGNLLEIQCTNKRVFPCFPIKIMDSIESDF